MGHFQGVKRDFCTLINSSAQIFDTDFWYAFLEQILVRIFGCTKVRKSINLMFSDNADSGRLVFVSDLYFLYFFHPSLTITFNND